MNKFLHILFSNGTHIPMKTHVDILIQPIFACMCAHGSMCRSWASAAKSWEVTQVFRGKYLLSLPRGKSSGDILTRQCAHKQQHIVAQEIRDVTEQPRRNVLAILLDSLSNGWGACDARWIVSHCMSHRKETCERRGHSIKQIKLTTSHGCNRLPDTTYVSSVPCIHRLLLPES